MDLRVRACALFVSSILVFFVAVNTTQAASDVSPGAHLSSDTGTPPSIGAAFAGEEFRYSLSFWVFNNVAEGRISLKRDGTDYLITMQAETTGIARWLRHRKDKYVARISEVEAGKRFRPISFEKEVTIGDKHRRTHTVIDYDKNIMRWQKWKNGKLRKTDQLSIPEGLIYDDPLTAFFNFRYGVYGEIGKGKDFLIKTFPKDDGKEVDITIRLITDAELKGRKIDLPGVEGYFADAKLAKELFDSKTGKIEIFFDKDLVPLVVVAKDVMFFGDVRGELVWRSK